MKSLILSITLLLLSLVSAAQSMEGTWHLDWNETLAAMSTEEYARFTGLPAETKTRMEATFSNREFSFSTTGAIEVNFAINGTAHAETGTWSLEGQVLTITINNQPRVYDVVWVSSEAITLGMQGGAAGALFSKLYLRKQ